MLIFNSYVKLLDGIGISWDNDRNPGWWCNNHLEKYEEFVNGVGMTSQLNGKS